MSLHGGGSAGSQASESQLFMHGYEVGVGAGTVTVGALHEVAGLPQPPAPLAPLRRPEAKEEVVTHESYYEPS